MTDLKSAVDEAVIEELKNLDDGVGDILKRLVAMFNESTPARLESIRKGLAALDLGSVSAEAHSLKSSCGNLGAMAMAKLCQVLEDGKKGATEHAQLLDALRKLEAEYVVVRKELEALAAD